MPENYFTYEGAQLHYYTYGNGPKVMLAFHGFGQNGQFFSQMAKNWAEDFIFFSFDLFFHGNSTWKEEKKPIDKIYWGKIITSFLKENKISEFSLMGYSIGAKLALATIEAVPESIKSIYLLAPDGIKNNLWYKLATTNPLISSYFKSMIHKPTRFYNLIKLAQKLKIIDKGVVKFAATQMLTIENRKRVYYTWMIFSKLNFNMNNIARIIDQYHLPVKIYLGTYDKIITAKIMESLTKKSASTKVIMVKSGHNNLIQNVSNDI
ncbi:alpha/beta hydrolase [Fulvivirga ligni]|uniref:alpha/beta hydrolase n=1 Tax=Fulvivirga ligni TaxID=2904246 RepID=UPI001F24A82D|nr:alpha/beta hydrolase [Fulvivirga ligni]UII23524.1 alpha/beta hydrolase [Fulvivirga ligni]